MIDFQDKPKKHIKKIRSVIFMKEVEVKILEVDKDALVHKLKEMGAKEVFSGIVESTLFDYPDERLKEKGDVIRLRNQGNKTILTYKELLHTDDAKVNNEYEVEVSSFEDTRKIIEELGFVEIDYYKKRRETYNYKDFHIEFDLLMGDYDFIPEFIEVEGPDYESIVKFAKKLGYKEEDCKAWGGDVLIDHYVEDMKLKGIVESGFGRGAKFVKIYSKKIKEMIGFEPFPGTLNLKVKPHLRKIFLSTNGRKVIEEFEKDGKVYGAVYLYEVKLQRGVDASIIIPVKTSHTKGVLEIIAAQDLRGKFDISNGAEVVIGRREKKEEKKIK